MKTKQIPVSQLAKVIGVPDIFFKLERDHKYGSHKGRSIPFMLKRYAKGIPIKEEQNGELVETDRIQFSNFVISSSGNAALAAIRAVNVHNKNNENNITLQVFVGKNIDSGKLLTLQSEIEDDNISVEQVERPKQTAFQMEKENEDTVKNLRQSTDDLALQGYFDLAVEISKIPNLQAVFIPTSSGTCAQGVGEAFAKLEIDCQIHIVQTEACHPIAGEFNKSPLEEGKDEGNPPLRGARGVSIAGAIVDKVAHRKTQVIEHIKKSKGSGWVVSDDEIKQAQELTKQNSSFEISTNSALSVAGLKKAMDNGWDIDGVVVCLITGR